jgi:hypothetical protein
VPSALSVVDPIVPEEVPPLREKVTFKPPEDKLLPAASFACSLKVAAAPEATVDAVTETRL